MAAPSPHRSTVVKDSLVSDLKASSQLWLFSYIGDAT